jgi:chromate reductase, NAD(P)H dehydrogenase (quinone)
MNQSVHQEEIRYLVFSASLRGDSFNSDLAALAARSVRANGGDVDLASMADFDCPSFNQDLEAGQGFPDPAKEFRRRLQACDGFVISSPEYNASMPAALKNSIDWVSRFNPQPFNERHALLLSASPSMAGGNRGLWALRMPLEHLGARVYPDMFSLAQAHLALDADGTIRDAQLQQRFEDNVTNFMNLVEASKLYPCAKRAWVEFLGEHVDAQVDRIQTSAATGR